MIISDRNQLHRALDIFSEINLETHKQFKTGSGFQTKVDRSPVTATDLANDRRLREELPTLVDLNVLSEENYPTYSERRDLESYWLIDPLDGTKEFIAGHSDFSVLIALIQDGRPTFSAILVPATDQIFLAEKNHGVRLYTGGNETPIHPSLHPEAPRGLVSRFHAESEVEEFYAKNNVPNHVQRGSALKFCALVTGEADVYYRNFGPYEWDIAAGDLLVTEAGGTVISFESGRPLRYGSETARSDSFLAAAPGFDVQSWRAI